MISSRTKATTAQWRTSWAKGMMHKDGTSICLTKKQKELKTTMCLKYGHLKRKGLLTYKKWQAIKRCSETSEFRQHITTSRANSKN